MQIQLTNTKGTFDVTQLTPTVKWAGDYQQAARSLDFSLLTSATDNNIPVIDCPVGAAVRLVENGEALFDGFVVTRTKSTEGNAIDLACFDRGFYLKRNYAVYQFSARTPEDIARQVALDFGISVGYLAPTGLPISRNFLSGRDSLYDIILTGYSLASKATGAQYHVGFRGPHLYVTVKAPDDRTLVIGGGSNLISAATTESIDKMVNAVRVYSAAGTLVQELTRPQDITAYGRLQSVVKQTANDNGLAKAQQLLDEGGITQKITVDCLGNVANVAGGTVVVQEPYTGILGLFYIDSDTHEWRRGQYYNKLVLNYKRQMDAKEAGELPNAGGGKTAPAAKASKAVTAAAAETPKSRWDFAHGNASKKEG